MKITHVVENLERGGLERVVVDLAGMQHQAGHDCKVVCLFEAGALAPELRRQGVSVHACGKGAGPDVRALLRLRLLLRARREGVIHTHNATAHYHAAFALFGLAPSRLLNTRHGMGAEDGNSRRERLYRLSMPLTHGVAAVCEAARDRFQSHGLRPSGGIEVVRNGIHVERFRPSSLPLRRQLAVELGFPEGTRLVGTVGRLNAVKEQASMIHALSRLQGVDGDVALVLVGDGPLRGELERCAQQAGVAERVRFLGDRGDVHRLLPGLEVFALSSRSEGYSIALLEAAASALPIVATDVGGNAEIVRHGVMGELVPAGDTEALAAALSRVLADQVAAERMRIAARDWALREASLQSMARRYMAFYESTQASDGQLGVLCR
jgi:glycosyltransferase involved in cell wall biosynthesis